MGWGVPGWRWGLGSVNWGKLRAVGFGYLSGRGRGWRRMARVGSRYPSGSLSALHVVASGLVVRLVVVQGGSCQ